MKFNELEDKNFYNNIFGKNCYIHSYIYYGGTKEINITIKSGYGLNQNSFQELIKENDLASFIKSFKVNKSINKNNSSTCKKNMETKDLENNLLSLRTIMFDSMKKVLNGNLDSSKAKSISMLGQTVINSYKIEIEQNKINKQ